MKKYLTILFLVPYCLFSQVDLQIDSVFMRFGAGSYNVSGLDYYELYTGEYPVLPISYSVLVTNQGPSDATNVIMEVTAQGSITSPYQSIPVDICSGCTDSINVIGNYTSTGWITWQTENFIYNIFSDSIDYDPINNKDTFLFFQSNSYYLDFHYRRDNGIFHDSIYTDSSNCINAAFNEIGNVTEFYQDDVINGLIGEISHDTNQIGTIFRGYIYKLNPIDTTWYQIAYSPSNFVQVISQNDLGGIIYSPFESDVCLDSGDVILSTIRCLDGNAQWMLAQDVEFGTVFKKDSTCTFAPVSNPKAVAIYPGRDYWSTYCNAPYIGYIDIEKKQHFSFSPNPSSGNVQLTYSTYSNSQNSLFISDLSGKRVKFIDFGSEFMGDHTRSVDLSNMEDGVYFISLQMGDQIQTERLLLIR